MVHYPTCTDGNFSPSELLALDDPILTSLSSVNKTRLPIIKFPPTRIFVAEVDPVRDQGIILGQHLSNIKTDVEVYHMNDYVHGYL